MSGNNGVAVAKTEIGTIAGVICNDAGFPQFIAQAGRAGADILISPALDWPGVNRLTTPSFSLRATENGMAYFRVVEQGQSVAVDSFGIAHLMAKQLLPR